jgi:hypothetical protein
MEDAIWERAPYGRDTAGAIQKRKWHHTNPEILCLGQFS